MKPAKIILKILANIVLIVFLLFVISFSVIYYQTSRETFKYQDKIEKYAKENDMDPLLIAAIIKVESGYDENAQSEQDAKGIMQIMDETAMHVANLKAIDYNPDNLNDVDYNLKIGSAYISYLYDYYNNYDLAFAAYNGGIGNVDNWIDNGILQRSNVDITKIPVKETRQYVQKVNSNYKILKTFYKDKLPDDDQLDNRLKLSFRNYKEFLKLLFKDTWQKNKLKEGSYQKDPFLAYYYNNDKIM